MSWLDFDYYLILLKYVSDCCFLDKQITNFKAKLMSSWRLNNFNSACVSGFYIKYSYCIGTTIWSNFRVSVYLFTLLYVIRWRSYVVTAVTPDWSTYGVTPLTKPYTATHKNLGVNIRLLHHNNVTLCFSTLSAKNTLLKCFHHEFYTSLVTTKD